jgi:YD repeat-containing protein
MNIRPVRAFFVALGLATVVTSSIDATQAAALVTQYDTLHRLTRIDYDNGTSIAYTYDAAGNRLSLVAQAGIPPDRTAPVIQITQPTTERLYVTTASSIPLAGTASDATGVAALSCTNDTGAQGSVAGTTTWTAGPIALSNGLNRISVAASDPTGNVGRASLLVVALSPNTVAQAIFEDNFDDNVIASRWHASGNIVQEIGQNMQIRAAVENAGGFLSSDPIPISRTGLVSITRHARLHYGNNYFVGSFRIAAGSLNPFGVYYANMDYEEQPHYFACHGFYLGRDDQSPHEWVTQENDTVGPTTAIWDTWFDEKLTYDPVSGQLDYYVNNEHRLAFAVGALPIDGPATLTLQCNTAGWYTGHEHFMDDLVIVQAVGAESTPFLVRDTDLDGIPDWSEIVAGTSPADDGSFLKIDSAGALSGENRLVRWSSVAGIFYSVNRATNLADANAFVPLKTNILGLEGATQYSDTNAPIRGPSFYRITVDY